MPSWMEFEPGDQNRLGQQGSNLGRNLHIGSRIQSVGERVRLHLRLATMEEYRRYLPGAPGHDQLCDIVFWYLGKSYDVVLRLSLRADEVKPATLGATAELGWMAALAPPAAAEAEEFVDVTTLILDWNSQKTAA